MQVRSILWGALLCLLSFQAHAATTLLPPGMQCFTDANGPVSAGSLNMFFPSTTTPKPTWQDSNQNTLNTQPIALDSNGCATIYGIGSYRQQLYDGPVVSGAPTGNLIFDKITTDTSAYNSVFWAALAGGTPNVITIVDTGFNATDGTVINFTALATNTGSTTINPSSFGAISVLKDTTGGPVSLTGGEIIQNNIISVVYRAQDNAFHLLNPPIQSASGANTPRCGVSGLKITNGTSPNSLVLITAGDAVMSSSSGLVINRANINVNLNITIGTTSTTPNGMDGEAPGSSTWIYVFLIDNGSSTAALGTASTGNGLTPNLPSGYVYSCRVGAVQVDGSSNLFRTIQLGHRAQYTVTTASNTASLISLAVGSTGSVTVPTWTAVTTAACVPPTATQIFLTIYTNASGQFILAPNNNYGASNDATNPPWINQVITSSPNPSGVNPSLTTSMLLESSSIYWASNSASGHIWCGGYIDNVNAN
jgi:hypothetical protein